jgi:hypothetical protein
VAESDLALRYRYQISLTELALFIYSSIIQAASTTWRIFRLSSPNKTLRARYGGLSKWNATCAIYSDPLILPEGPVPPQYFSIGAKDVRIGNFLARLDVSRNRGIIYNCLIDFINGNYFSHTFGNFFIYFAELYHPAYKQHREKRVLI